VALALLLGGVLGGIALFHRTGGAGRAPASPTGAVHATGRVRVEVLNGGGRAGAAREATEQLRTQGFDVVYFGNAASFDVDSSAVLDRVGDLGPARDVARAMGIGNVRSEPDSTLFVDVSVVLGRDWLPAAAKGLGADPDPPTRHWWDPRRWFGR
jgi:hypothetical protein